MAEKIPGIAEKLDEEFNQFLSQLKPRKPGEDAWPEDRWEEEMEKHPFFMTKQVEEGQELPPLVEALQQLKFDPEQNTPEELAVAYKEEGNQFFKLKKYKYAITSYTEGIKTNSENQEINAILYANRSAAEFQLGNFQRALNDCIKAIDRSPTHIKAIYRAAQCCLKLKKIQDCLSWCEKGLNIENEDLKLRESLHCLKKEATTMEKVLERDKRKVLMKVTQETKEWAIIKMAIKNRGINFEQNDNFGIPNWWPSDQSFGDSRVYLDNDCLIWPVLILYPEYNVTDFIQHFNENSSFYDHLQEMFSPENEPSWDKEHKYKLHTVNISYVHENVIFSVNIEESLKNILCSKNFFIHGGVPTFFITAKNSAFDKFWQTNGLTSNKS